MGKQIDLYDEKDYSDYFELFQKQTDFSDNILEKAEKIKDNIQEIYKNVSFQTADSDFKAWVFDFDVILKQASEHPEPSASKLFTRKYTPIVNVYKNGSIIATKTFKDEAKFIHKYINELFVGDSISQEYFFDLAQQYFLLDFLYNQMENGTFSTDFFSKINESIKIDEGIHKDDLIVISVNCKLRGRNMPKDIHPNLKSVISHIKTLWESLSSRQTSYCIMGNYKNYLNENEFIIQLNDEDTGLISERILKYFQNDFQLLNNMEFMSEKPYTVDWNDRIFAPILIEKNSDNYNLKNIDFIKSNKDQIFLFQKTKDDGLFYKSELFIPEKDMTQENFERIVSLSMKLLKSKEREEK